MREHANSDADTGVTRRRLLGLAGTGVAAGLAGCGAILNLDSEAATEVRTVAAAGLDALSVGETEDDITVVTESREDVRIEARKRVKGEVGLDAVGVDATVDDGHLSVSTSGPNAVDLGGWSVDLELAVPQSVDVDRLHTGDGDIEARGVSGDATVESGDGNISVSETDGSVTAETGDGDISVSETDGSVTAETGDGDVTVDDVSGVVDAATGDGDIIVEETDSRVTAETGDGDVRVRNPGEVAAVTTGDGDITVDLPAVTRSAAVESGDGDITARLGPDLNADVAASTGDGDVRVRSPPPGLELRTQRGTRVELVAGDGDSRVTVETTDGDVTLRGENA
jgi:DUF4097 and DUF4098 domain-containing protein YvlB